MIRPRVIPALLLKGQGLVKTQKFSDPKYLGDPINIVKIFNDKEVDELGSRKEVEYVHKILEMGTGADRQLEVWEKNQDGNEVVDYVISETYQGLEISP